MISAAYKAEQRRLHQERPDYGVASISYAPYVTNLINQLKVEHVLDYGCGKGRLGENLAPDHKVFIHQYDPGIEGLDQSPDPAEMVCCIDVLEHIEPEHLDSVLDDLKRVTLRYGFFSIHTGPAAKTLSDGRNAHLIQEDFRWWLPKLWSRFHIHMMTHTPDGFNVLVQPYGA